MVWNMRGISIGTNLVVHIIMARHMPLGIRIAFIPQPLLNFLKQLHIGIRIQWVARDSAVEITIC